MSYVLSVLGLAVACIAWYGVQRLAGSEPPSCRRSAERDCEGCDAVEACAGAETGERAAEEG